MNPLEDGQHNAEEEVNAEVVECDLESRTAAEAEGRSASEVKVVKAPVEPCAADVERHNTTHAEFRSWCEACVRGRGLSAHHRRDARRKNPCAVPEVVMDYCFQGQADEEAAIILGIRDRKTGATDALVLPAKGYEQWIMKAIVAILDNFGHPKITIKSDGERPIGALKRAVQMARRQHITLVDDDGEERDHEPCETLTEDAPKGESKSNGATFQWK